MRGGERWRGGLGFLIAVSGLLLGKAAAHNPTVTLKLENVSYAEAAQALAEAASVPVEVQVGAAGVGVAAERLKQRTSFHWQEIRFADALRELCAAYQLQPVRVGGGYAVMPLSASLPRPRSTVSLPTVSQGGTTLSIRSLVVETLRAERFGEAPPGESTRLAVTFSCRTPEGAAALRGVANVVAKDDRGTILVPDNPSFLAAPAENLFPDEWRGGVFLTGPHPEARRLEWLEGEVIGYQNRRVVNAMFPLPVQSGKQRFGDLAVEVEGLSAPPANSPLPTPSSPNGRVLRVRVTTPAGTLLQTYDGYPDVMPLLETDAGQFIRPVPGTLRCTRSTQGRGWVYEITGAWPELRAAPARLRLQFLAQSEPRVLYPFRFTQVPLPAGVFQQARLSQVLRLDRPVAFARPEGEGALESVVRIPGSRPVGTLWLGFSRKTTEGWGRIEWRDVRPDAGGRAVVGDLIPGRYRVLRVFVADPGSMPPTVLRWENSEGVIEVRSERPGVLPPLVAVLPGRERSVHSASSAGPVRKRR